jgi:Tol biopolymer transport system component
VLAACARRPPAARPVAESVLEVYDVASGARRVVYRAPRHFEAPNWSRDGRWLIVNSGGRLFRVAVDGGEPHPIDTGARVRCNNDHGLSPDGRLLAISDGSEGPSAIYVLPSEGGSPRRVTPLSPSYWHGWSPDGATLVFCGARGGNYDIYAVPVDGGPERRLTTADGLDDGPDFAHDGAGIYFNSERTGTMRIWRMDADGANQRQVTRDDAWADWFPHPSPDGRLLVFLSYDASVKGHPPDKDVVLRLMQLPDGAPAVIARLRGGQGTINVPSWSPDGRSFAFVSYRYGGR